MGKAENRKRAKMMRLRKKERELLQNTESLGIKEIKSRLSQNHKGKSVKLQNGNPEVKISNVINEMIAPLTKKANSFQEEKELVDLGVMAWNLGIVKAYNGEDAMLKWVTQFGKELSNDFKNILITYAEKKSTEYPDYDQFIHDHEFKSIGQNRNSLSVAYKPFKKDK